MLTICRMTKDQAKKLFSNVRELSGVVGYTPSYFYSLPDELPQRESDRILGAAVRVKKIKARLPNVLIDAA